VLVPHERLGAADRDARLQRKATASERAATLDCVGEAVPCGGLGARAAVEGRGDGDVAASMNVGNRAGDDWAAGITAVMNAPGRVRGAMSVARFG
jgi:hypothetical protein